MNRGRRRPATPEEASALASAVRVRILRLTLDQPRTNKELATALGLTPATTHYHVRRLLGTGFLVAEPASRAGRDIPYRATGKSWQLELVDSDVRAVTADAMLDAFIAEWSQAGPAAERLATRYRLTLDPERLAEFRQRFSDLLEEYGEPRSAARSWSVLLAIHEEHI